MNCMVCVCVCVCAEGRGLTLELGYVHVSVALGAAFLVERGRQGDDAALERRLGARQLVVLANHVIVALLCRPVPLRGKNKNACQ